MYQHATKSGKRHRKFFCTIDVPSIQRHIRMSSKGPCVSRLRYLYGQKQACFPRSNAPPYSEADMWVGADYKIQ